MTMMGVRSVQPKASSVAAFCANRMPLHHGLSFRSMNNRCGRPSGEKFSHHHLSHPCRHFDLRQNNAVVQATVDTRLYSGSDMVNEVIPGTRRALNEFLYWVCV